jgi:hypothetical protein
MASRQRCCTWMGLGKRTIRRCLRYPVHCQFLALFRPVEGGFLPFYRFLELAEGLFALRVERIPDRSGSLADFCFHCDSFPFAQSSPCEYTLHFRPNEAGEACSREEDLKVVRDLRLRCGDLGFDELRDDAELLHKAQSVPVDPAFYHLAASEASDAYSRDGDLPPPCTSRLMGGQFGP